MRFAGALHRIFLRFLNWIFIMPKPDKVFSWRDYTYVVLVGLVSLASYISSMCLGLNFDTRTELEFKTEAGRVMMKFVQDISEGCGQIILILILYFYTKTDLWQTLYVSLSFALRPPYTSGNIKLMVGIFAFTHVTSLNVATTHFFHVFDYEGDFSIGACLMMFPWLRMCYTLNSISLIILVILGIGELVWQARAALLINKNVKAAKRNVYESVKVLKIFNEGFGYILLILYGQWMLYLLQLFFGAVVMGKSQEKLDQVHSLSSVGLSIVTLPVIASDVAIRLIVSINPVGLTNATIKMKAPRIDMCYNIFLNYAYFLGLIPRRNRRAKWERCTLTTIVFILITAMFVMSFYYRFNNLRPYHGASTRRIILELLFDLLMIFGLIKIGVALKTSLNDCDWKTLYENLDAIKCSDECCGKGTGLVLFLFILTCVSQTFILIIRSKVMYLKIADVSGVLIMWMAPALVFYHTSAMTTLMLLILMKIERKLSEVRRKYLTIPKIKIARTVYSRVAIAVKMFNRIFAYQLLLSCIQWLIAIEIVFLRVVFLSVSEDYISKYLSLPAAVMVGLMNIFQAFFGPCAIAFSCDSVTSEADKLLAACQEVQETFDPNSSEYRELESLSSYISTKVIRFTAANFVEIKRSTLLSIVACAATYFVALVQFY